MGALYVALLHGDVVDKTGKEVATSLTHFDVHDIARTCRAYGVDRYFVVTPLESMRYLAERMLSYWRGGLGADRIPNREEALEVVEVVRSLEEALEAIGERDGAGPRIACTSAKPARDCTEFAELARAIREETAPILLLFGTAYGLGPGILARCRDRLPPIRGGGWNHLSVRSAVAVVLDRLVGEEGKRVTISDP